MNGTPAPGLLRADAGPVESEHDPSTPRQPSGSPPAGAPVDYEAIAVKFGSPTYVYDAAELRRSYRLLRDSLHPRLQIFFSLKSNPNLSVCAVLGRCGAGAEVSSLVELRTALAAGIDASDVVFLGPGKSLGELRACLDSSVGVVVVESWQELDLLDELAAERGTVRDVALRVNPSCSTKGSRLTMGGRPRQFGIDEEQVLAAGPRLGRLRNLRVRGIHVYQGTRILDASVVAANTQYALDLAARIADELPLQLDVVDVGGGLGVAYFKGEEDLDIAALAATVNPAIDAFARQFPRTRLALESGRFLTALAGTYVVSVRYVKESLGERFAVADGGTNHHMAAAGIGSFVRRNFPVTRLSRVQEPQDLQPWTVTGPLCTPNDTLTKHALLPDLRPGDLLGIGRSGAYGASASPGLFLGHGFPAEVLVDRGVAHLVRRRDTPDDLLASQRLIEEDEN